MTTQRLLIKAQRVHSTEASMKCHFGGLKSIFLKSSVQLMARECNTFRNCGKLEQQSCSGGGGSWTAFVHFNGTKYAAPALCVNISNSDGGGGGERSIFPFFLFPSSSEAQKFLVKHSHAGSTSTIHATAAAAEVLCRRRRRLHSIGELSHMQRSKRDGGREEDGGKWNLGNVALWPSQKQNEFVGQGQLQSIIVGQYDS